MVVASRYTTCITTIGGFTMAAQLGAHETMEVHEVLTTAINGINQFQLLRPIVKDQQLLQIVDRQLQFMVNEYNGMIQILNQQGQSQAVPYQSPKNVPPVYGLDNPAAQTPNQSMNQMDDRDVASGMLCHHKASAIMKMTASLECADHTLRKMIQQGAANCSEQAYEVWQYMNQNGYYQVPTMKDVTTNTMLNTYQAAGSNQMNTSYQQEQQQQQPQSGYLKQ